MKLKPYLDLTREELNALGKHLGMEGMWHISQRRTVKQMIALKLKFHRALPPYELPEQDSPLWYAMRKLHRASETDGVHHGNVHNLFFTMVGLGGEWESLDDPIDKSVGFARADGSLRQAVYYTHLKETWGLARNAESRWVQREWDVPGWFRKLMGSPGGRAEMARILTSGDHCLEFPFEDDVPPIVHRYIANGGWI